MIVVAYRLSEKVISDVVGVAVWLSCRLLYAECCAELTVVGDVYVGSFIALCVEGNPVFVI